MYYSKERKVGTDSWVNERTATCCSCGRKVPKGMGRIFVTPQQQKSGRCLCCDCRGRRGLRGYGEENYTFVGTNPKGKYKDITLSIELESMGNSSSAKAFLIGDQKFIATSDTTVDIEYKSPIMFGLSSIAKVISYVDYMDKSENYNFSVNNEDCGAHIHFGVTDECRNDNHNFDFREFGTRRHKKITMALFAPLTDYIESLSGAKLENYFGSNWRSYAHKMYYDEYDLFEHSNWINFQHPYSVEFRLPRIANAEQYMNCIRGFRDIFAILKTDFIETNEQFNMPMETIEKIGRKMRRVAEEYFPN